MEKDLCNSTVEDGLKSDETAFVRDRSYTQAEHGACTEMLHCFGCRSPHSVPSRSFVHPQGRVRCGWINLCFPSWYTSLFQSTLKMKPVPKTHQVSQLSKGMMLKISYPCFPPSPDRLCMSRCWQKLFVVFPSSGEWQKTGVKWENEM